VACHVWHHHYVGNVFLASKLPPLDKRVICGALQYHCGTQVIDTTREARVCQFVTQVSRCFHAMAKERENEKSVLERNRQIR
jgi:hypothetical protein